VQHVPTDKIYATIRIRIRIRRILKVKIRIRGMRILTSFVTYLWKIAKVAEIISFHFIFNDSFGFGQCLV